MGQRPHPRPAVQSALSAHIGPDLGRRHREVPLVRHDPGRWPGLRKEARAGLWREGIRRHRGNAGPAARGRRDRAGSRCQHSRRLGRAEGGAGNHGLPAQPRCRHRSGGEDIQDLWRRCHPGHDREPLPTGPRHPGHRLQDRRRHRHEARYREDGDDPGSRWHFLCADRGHGRGALRPADG